MKMKLGFLSGRDGIFINKNKTDDCVDDKDVPNLSNPNRKSKTIDENKEIQKKQ